MNNFVKIFDTTLRDGEQSPGATMTSAEKIEVAKHLAKLKVDVIEAGFPAASPDDLQAVQRVAQEIGNPGDGLFAPAICGLARTKKEDIAKAWDGVKFALHPRIHTFIATSEIHMEHKLKMTREQVVDKVREMVSYARSLCADIEFSPEDAGRSEPTFLYYVLAEAIKAGATTLNIPDTVGYTTPAEFGDLISGILKNTSGIEQAIISVHCHNDLGLATANTLAGLKAGARQAEVTINGIGERAGNTALEEVVMTLHTRKPYYNLETNIDTTQITRLSRLISNYTGIVVQPNKAIVGSNAFAHEAGIHQDGMLKNKSTYEIMLPETVGLSQSNLVLGKHSGRHALKIRMQSLGYMLEESELVKLFDRFKLLADKKKTITDADLIALVSDEIYQPREIYRLDGLQVACGTMGLPTATVRLVDPEGNMQIQACVGTGPVDAAFKAIDKIIQASNTLQEFAINAVTEGIDALGEVTVRIEGHDSIHKITAQQETGMPRTYGGHGADTDIIVASAKAYLSAINKLLIASGQYDVVESQSVQPVNAN